MRMPPAIGVVCSEALPSCASPRRRSAMSKRIGGISPGSSTLSVGCGDRVGHGCRRRLPVSAVPAAAAGRRQGTACRSGPAPRCPPRRERRWCRRCRCRQGAPALPVATRRTARAHRRSCDPGTATVAPARPRRAVPRWHPARPPAHRPARAFAKATQPNASSDGHVAAHRQVRARASAGAQRRRTGSRPRMGRSRAPARAGASGCRAGAKVRPPRSAAAPALRVARAPFRPCAAALETASPSPTRSLATVQLRRRRALARAVRPGRVRRCASCCCPTARASARPGRRAAASSERGAQAAVRARAPLALDDRRSRRPRAG